MRGVIFLAKKFGQIFWLLLWPWRKLLKIILRRIILPIYNWLHLAKKHGQEDLDSSDNRLSIFTHKYWLYVLIFILCLSVIGDNFRINSVAAEDLGKSSLLYQIAQGGEFEQDIIEQAADLSDKEIAEKLARQNNLEFLDPSGMALVRDEIITGEVDESNLQQLIQIDGLEAEAVLKTGIPATYTSPQAQGEVQEYAVQSGDTISSIAKKFNISINTILWANDLSGLSIIRPGDKLTILPTNGVLHRVVKNDTLSAIAKKYNVEQDVILNYNHLVSNDQLNIDQFIIVPGGEIKQTYQRASSGFASIFKPPSTETKTGGFIWPTSARKITQYYSWRHYAIDIGGPVGTPIYASLAGKITHAGWGTGYGYYVIIDHGGGKKTLYAHFSKIYVSVGDQVVQGAVIGAMGSTGWSTGPHLHFEIIINGTKVNPLSYL